MATNSLTTAPVSNRHSVGFALLAAYLALYAVVLYAMATRAHFDPSDALTVAAILGVGFSLAAWLFTIGVKPLPYLVSQPAREVALVAIYLIAVTAVVTWGFDWIRQVFPVDPVQAFALLALKLAVFVAIPLGIMRSLSGYRWRDLSPIAFSRRHMFAIAGMSVLLIAFQSVLGRGLRDIRATHVPASTLIWGLPLALFWCCLEMGVVEEFFFRCLLQSRLTVLLRSELGGIIVASLVFGLMHAPGMYLRTAVTQEGLPPHPALWLAVSYSIVITSIAGFLFGVLWARTRNFAVVVLVHGAADLLPNFLPTLRSLHLLQ
jgi:membrane protease YdiL (CAAX protease family)